MHLKRTIYFVFLNRNLLHKQRKILKKQIWKEEMKWTSVSQKMDVISDVDVNQNDSDSLPEIELGEENAPPVQRNQRVRRAPEAMKA
ncbi:hypothetical protein JTB14_029646 [Gonioctena quinquepunctata]|nr:hypothetical protein JTB14_029646 [Gonioctena quinquepunctata]